MGDAACWLDEVCDACGAVPDGGRCRCGPQPGDELLSVDALPESVAWHEQHRRSCAAELVEDPTGRSR